MEAIAYWKSLYEIACRGLKAQRIKRHDEGLCDKRKSAGKHQWQASLKREL